MKLIKLNQTQLKNGTNHFILMKLIQLNQIKINKKKVIN